MSIGLKDRARIDIQNPTAYNRLNGTPLDQQTPATEEHDNSRIIIAVAVTLVIGVALAAAFLLRKPPSRPKAPSPYIAKLKLSDFKMSAAENFIGATVSYIDGTITNTGDKSVTHVMVQVNFEDSMGQVAQREDSRSIVKSNGAYEEPVDLNVSRRWLPAKAHPSA